MRLAGACFRSAGRGHGATRQRGRYNGRLLGRQHRDRAHRQCEPAGQNADGQHGAPGTPYWCPVLVCHTCAPYWRPVLVCRTAHEPLLPTNRAFCTIWCISGRGCIRSQEMRGSRPPRCSVFPGRGFPGGSETAHNARFGAARKPFCTGSREMRGSGGDGLHGIAHYARLHCGGPHGIARYVPRGRLAQRAPS